MLPSYLRRQHFEAPLRELPEQLPVAVLDSHLLYFGGLFLGQLALSMKMKCPRPFLEQSYHV